MWWVYSALAGLSDIPDSEESNERVPEEVQQMTHDLLLPLQAQHRIRLQTKGVRRTALSFVATQKSELYIIAGYSHTYVSMVCGELGQLPMPYHSLEFSVNSYEIILLGDDMRFLLVSQPESADNFYDEELRFWENNVNSMPRVSLRCFRCKGVDIRPGWLITFGISGVR
ncbi:unnamed protein product [Taenia asiatica]|uniref:FBA_3 domain-containing protein n=1 Tax=Taenia asiatica TaxID=60517 RepID=A0A0R3VYM6_TAEAS|nr:unnamed protein product [Taenia asiatica]